MRGIIFLFAAALLTVTAAVGLWQLRRWGYRLSIGLIVLNILGDLLTLVHLRQPQVIIAILTAVAVLVYLRSARVRSAFGYQLPVNHHQ